ncbi:SigE family RNA polymerase sigma factor [Streptomyces sp. NPDC001904]|uniref:RNA polymerase sigma factor n=1 Tax=Streptomyces sp. NPDC001904 TaxID=3154531 RepID=UPI003332FEFF
MHSPAATQLAPRPRPFTPSYGRTRPGWRASLRGLLRRDRSTLEAAPGQDTPRHPSGYGGTHPYPRPDRPPTVSELYHAHRLRMVRLAVLLVDDPATAEDVVQDAFTALYRRHGERITEVDNALGYLRTSVVNTARSVLRRRRTARAWTPPPAGETPSAEDSVVLDEAHREVLAALARLTPRRREVLVLRYWADLSEAEIAATLGISRGAVKSNASRALDALEKILEGRI